MEGFNSFNRTAIEIGAAGSSPVINCADNKDDLPNATETDRTFRLEVVTVRLSGHHFRSSVTLCDSSKEEAGTN